MSIIVTTINNTVSAAAHTTNTTSIGVDTKLFCIAVPDTWPWAVDVSATGIINDVLYNTGCYFW